MRHISDHFHLSLQSGSDEVLKRMHRFYTAEEAACAMDRVRKIMPEVLFTTDIITGFPGETDEMFAQTAEFIKAHPFLHIHIFPYSQRKQTKAAKYPDQVPVRIRRERAALLASIQAECVKELLSPMLGSTHEVLFETVENGIASGHTSNFIEVRMKTDKDVRGLTLPVRFISLDGEIIHAEQKGQ